MLPPQRSKRITKPSLLCHSLNLSTETKSPVITMVVVDNSSNAILQRFLNIHFFVKVIFIVMPLSVIMGITDVRGSLSMTAWLELLWLVLPLFNKTPFCSQASCLFSTCKFGIKLATQAAVFSIKPTTTTTNQIYFLCPVSGLCNFVSSPRSE